MEVYNIMNEYGKRVAKKMENFMDEPDSVDREINDIQNAIEGYEVRGALAAGVKKSFDKSKDAEDRSNDAYEITQNLLDDSFDTSLINQNFDQRLNSEIENLQPEWTGFKNDVTNKIEINEEEIEKLNDKNLMVESSLNALGNNNSFDFPIFIKSTEPLVVGNNDPSGDGQSGFDFAYATVLKAYRYLSNPIDNYYMYVASHDGDGIYLYTSSVPEGPWEIYNNGEPIFKANLFPWGLGHVSSPDVQTESNNVFLYVHTPTSETENKQYTSLAISNNGIDFSAYGDGPILKPEHEYRWNGISTTYLKIIKVGNSYYGVYQANNGLINDQVGDVTTSIGVVYSQNGLDWNLSDAPFLINPPDSRGPFSPALIYWNGYFLVLYRLEDTNIRGVITKDFQSYEEVGVILPKGSTGEWDDLKVATPFFMYENGKLYMYYGGFGREKTGIGLAIAEVERI